MSKQKSSSTTWTSNQLSSDLTRYFSNLGESLRPYQREIGGFTLLLLAFFVMLNLLGLTSGALPTALGNAAEALFGWGSIPVTLSLGWLGAALAMSIFKKEVKPLPLEMIIGMELVLIAGLALVHLTAGGSDPLALAREHGGGGYVGWSLSALLSDLLGKWIAGFAFLLIALAGVGLIIRLAMGEALAGVEEWQQPAPEPRPIPSAPPKKVKRQKAIKPQKPSMSAEQALQNAPLSPRRRPSAGSGQALPPIDLLAPAASSPDQSANARYQAQIIEDTLRGFGVPAQVVEVNYGPTVTQFGVKPGSISKRLSDGSIVEQRVRVSKINSLINDLALALAAAPIRIETPVPGRPIVGIEVPNHDTSLVSLRGAMESGSFRRKKGNLSIALGKGVNGSVAVFDLAAQPHLLIAGATGSGKSVCINAVIVNLLMTHPPERLKMLMIDPKMVELTSFNGLPHLIAPVVTDFEQVAGALAWVTREMERRYKAFAAAGTRNIGGYNRKVKPLERLPFMVVIIDELADLMMLAADEVERYITRIAQMARATGIHMIIATQRPSTDVVTGLIKANFPARIAFAVSSQIDSRVILDTPGAEKLLGKGDMLYMAPDSPKLARLQGCFVSDAEIKNIVTYWKRSGSIAASNPADDDAAENDEAQPLPWAGILEEANKDDMLKRAIQLVMEQQRASATFLQRKLGIGYPRASRLMDQLEEEGVIGPAQGGSARTVLWQEGATDT